MLSLLSSALIIIVCGFAGYLAVMFILWIIEFIVDFINLLF